MTTNIVTTPKTVNITTQKIDTQAEYQALIDGTNSLMPNDDPFVLAKRKISRAELFAEWQSRIDAAKATKSCRLALAAAVAHERQLDVTVKPLRGAFKTFAQSRFGKNAPELQELGFVQNRTPKKSAQKKAAGAVKAQTTRKARGTKGRQQRAAIPGAAAVSTAPVATGPGAGGAQSAAQAPPSAATSTAPQGPGNAGAGARS
ncbi:MAG TPA: hypothetical protein VGY54_12000 [Polyangiaceae bacterium]|jgi:hypothetical protein|nr:hypothetical protein [Polyangiaceae bacterium]